MTAPEQDRRIKCAEALGWTDIELLPAQKDPFTGEEGYLGDKPKWCGRNPQQTRFQNLPDPERNIADAMQLVEAARKEGYRVMMDDEGDAGWFVWLMPKHAGLRHGITGHDPDLCKAITEAFLKLKNLC